MNFPIAFCLYLYYNYYKYRKENLLNQEVNFMTLFKLECPDIDICSMYPLTELQKEQLIRRFFMHQIYAAAYNRGCYQNKINYIVWRLKL